MKSHSVSIHVKRIHDDIFSMTTGGEDMGYLVINEKNEYTPVSVVKPNGETLGEFCCQEHATNAALKSHLNLGDNCIMIDNDNPMGMLAKLFLASIFSNTTRH